MDKSTKGNLTVKIEPHQELKYDALNTENISAAPTTTVALPPIVAPVILLSPSSSNQQETSQLEPLAIQPSPPKPEEGELPIIVESNKKKGLHPSLHVVVRPISVKKSKSQNVQQQKGPQVLSSTYKQTSLFSFDDDDDIEDVSPTEPKNDGFSDNDEEQKDKTVNVKQTQSLHQKSSNEAAAVPTTLTHTVPPPPPPPLTKEQKRAALLPSPPISCSLPVTIPPRRMRVDLKSKQQEHDNLVAQKKVEETNIQSNEMDSRYIFEGQPFSFIQSYSQFRDTMLRQKQLLENEGETEKENLPQPTNLNVE